MSKICPGLAGPPGQASKGRVEGQYRDSTGTVQGHYRDTTGTTGTHRNTTGNTANTRQGQDSQFRCQVKKGGKYMSTICEICRDDFVSILWSTIFTKFVETLRSVFFEGLQFVEILQIVDDERKRFS